MENLKTTNKVGPFFIYALLDPDDLEIRYIGKSCSGMKRVNRHLYPCELKSNTYKNNWIRSLLRRNSRPIVSIIHTCSSKADLSHWEAIYILMFRRDGSRLTNQTDGGEGLSGYKMPDEHRRKIGKGNSGKIRSKLSISKCSIAQTNRWGDPEIRNRISQIRKTQQYREAQLISSKSARAIQDSLGNKYRSIKEAARICGISQGNISSQLSGKYKGHLKGLFFSDFKNG